MSTRSIVRISTVLLLAVALGLRVWGANFGLPTYVCHPDEPAVVERAAGILRTGDLNPKWFHYPSGYLYAQAVAYIVYFLWGAVRGNFAFVPEQTLPQFYLIGRLTTAFLGTLTVLVVYLIGRKTHRTRIGLTAAVFMTFSYLSVVHAHYVTTDVPSGFWVALCMLFSVLILQRGQVMWYVLAGLTAGLAAGTKYNAGSVVLLIPLAHIMSTKWGEWGWLDRRLMFGVLAAIGGFLLSTPYALLDLPTFLNGLGFELNHYNSYQPGYTGQSGVWYLRSMLTSADAPLALVYLGGLIHAMMRPTKSRILLATYSLFYYLGLARTAVHFERNLLPIIPALSVLAAVFLNDLVDWIASRTQRYRYCFSVAGTGLVVILPLIAILSFDWSITRLDIRTAAGAWISQNISEGTKLAIEHYSVPFPRDRYEVVDVLRLWDHDAAWYSEQGFEYVVASNGVWLTLPKEPARYAREMQVFRDLHSQYALVKEFIPHNVSPLVTMGYSTVVEYHFPHVWIFHFTNSTVQEENP